jgi:hypothetical protein
MISYVEAYGWRGIHLPNAVYRSERQETEFSFSLPRGRPQFQSASPSHHNTHTKQN